MQLPSSKSACPEISSNCSMEEFDDEMIVALNSTSYGPATRRIDHDRISGMREAF